MWHTVVLRSKIVILIPAANAGLGAVQTLFCLFFLTEKGEFQGAGVTTWMGGGGGGLPGQIGRQ